MIRSTDQQLRDIRETEGDFAITHIDTCLLDYLSDHHHRDGELLLGVYVDGSVTIGDVINGLESEFAAIAWDLGESRKGYDHDKAKAAISALRQSFHPMELDRTLFDSSLDLPDEESEDYEEACQAWFLIHWEVPEEEDEEPIILETSAGDNGKGGIEWQLCREGGGDTVLTFCEWITPQEQERIAKAIAAVFSAKKDEA